MGTPDFSVPVLTQLIDDGHNILAVVTQPDRPVGRKRTITPPPVKVAAEEHGIPVIQPNNIKEKSAYEEILAYKPDLIVTAAYGQIIPRTLLDGPKMGCINVHASLLPELRGGAPIHYAILQGKEKTGVTIMYMVEKLDAGDILTQVEVPIDERDHVGSLHNKLSVAGAKLLSETIPALERHELEPIKQDESSVTFASNITRDQERIDWSKAGKAIYNHIRGLHPWPVAFTTFEEKPLKIWWAEKVNGKGEPGEVIVIEEDGFVVATGDEIAIKVTELQPSGKKRMMGEEYLRGAGSGLKIGMKLGGHHG